MVAIERDRAASPNRTYQRTTPMTVSGGFATVRFGPGCAEIRHSVQGWVGPKGEWQFSGDRKRKQSFEGTSQTAVFDPTTALRRLSARPETSRSGGLCLNRARRLLAVR